MKYLIFLGMLTAGATISCNNTTDNAGNSTDTTMHTPDYIRNDLGADTSPMPVDTTKPKGENASGEDFR